MNKFKQSDKRWGNMKLGKTRYTMADYGCYITSIAMVVGANPYSLLIVFNKYKIFTDEGLLNNAKAAKALGMVYRYSSSPVGLCIAETDYYKDKGVPQHFFVWLGHDNLIVDPLTGKESVNKYPIVSFRIFKEKRR